MMNIIAFLLLVAASFRVGVAELLEYEKLLKSREPKNSSREPKQFHRKLTSVTYPTEAPNSTPLTNPERGFYTQKSYYAAFPQRLDATSLSSDMEEAGESVILRLYYLDTFLNSPISQDVLGKQHKSTT